MKYIQDISKWDYQDLLELPSGESEIFEYKSSKISLDQLKNKISIAASAFWNSGGGIFIAGVNDNGEIYGGIPSQNGKQSIRDWVDNAIKTTEPIGQFEIRTIPSDVEIEKIKQGNVVLVIKFFESSLVPHMAYDKKYYIRVGAHSEGAGHFLVEALRSLRHNIKPSLKGIMRFHPTKPKVEELMIVSINDSTALDVKLSFNPFPTKIGERFAEYFPLEIAFIDKNNPFRMEVSMFGIRNKFFGVEPIELILEYKDAIGNEYKTTQTINLRKNSQPMVIGDDVFEKFTKAIEKLADNLKD